MDGETNGGKEATQGAQDASQQQGQEQQETQQGQLSLSIRKSTLRYVDNRRFDSEHADHACKWRDLRPGGRAVPPQNGISQSSSNSFRCAGPSSSPTLQ